MSELTLSQVYELRQRWMYELLPVTEELARDLARDGDPRLRALAEDADQLALQVRSYLFIVSPSQDPLGERERRAAIEVRLAALQAKLDQLAGKGQRAAGSACSYVGKWGRCTTRVPHQHLAAAGGAR